MSFIVRVALVSSLLAFTAGALAACTTPPRSLLGFPLYEMDQGRQGIAPSADAILGDLDRIEAAIDASAPTGPDGIPPVRAKALHALLEAHLSRSANAISYHEPPQIEDPPYPPIVLYPRLTSPALVEPSLVAAAEGPALHWIVPLILDKDALYWDLSSEAVWFGRSPRRQLYHDPAKHVAAFLVEHGEMDLAKRHPVATRSYQVLLDPLEATLTDGTGVSLPHMLRHQFGLVLSIPVANQERLGPGFYNLQFFPRVPVDPTGMRTSWGRELAHAFAEGDWYRAHEQVLAFPGARRAGGAAAVEHDLVAVAHGIDGFLPTRFDAQLQPVRDAFERWSWDMPEPARLDGGVPHAVVQSLRAFLTRSHQPVPILLDEPGRQLDPFTFVASGDLQLSKDRRYLDRFLRLIGADGSHEGSEQARSMPLEVQARLRQVRFVVIAGDLADGEGLSSTPAKAVVAGLGLTPPLSPYRREFPIVRDALERCRVPIIAVPGNHDGFCSYGGLLNVAFNVTGDVLQVPPDPIRVFTHPLGHGLKEIGRHLPTLVKVGRLSRHPHFDGLVRWQYEFGPLNSAFIYHGCSFIAFNTYHLPQLYRDQVGPIANNWGGGVEPADALWFDVMVRWQRRQLEHRDSGIWSGHQFLFMHHDPRAAVPDAHGSGREIGYGKYDGPDAPFNAITFGWLGTDYSTANPLFLPIITPVGSNLWRLTRTGGRFDMEWMGPAWGADESCHNAESIVGSVTAGLARSHGGGGISHVFFGHNNEPVDGTWAETGESRRIFRPPPGRAWTGNPYGRLAPLQPFVKLRTEEPFAWGREARAPEGRNARVHRVDDLGDNGSKVHGFHLVTVYPNPHGAPHVVTTPITLSGSAAP